MSADEPPVPSVSVVVPVLNEAVAFDASIGSILSQDYAGEIEFLFVDGGSTDGTRERLGALAAADPRVRVVDNPRPGIPVSLNLGLRAARKELLVRMDAHSEYASDYVRRGADLIAAGRAEWVAGPAYARGDGDWSRWVAAALASRMGVGGADFRRSAEEVYTDTAFGGAIARRDLLRLGGWDESWVVNEDAELAARARLAGLRILLAPALAAYYIPRDDPRELARQYWRYGLWRAKTSVRHPDSMRPSHVLPPAVAVAAVLAALPGPQRKPALAAVVVYLVAIAAESLRLASGRPVGAAKLAVIFPVMHLAWGSGVIAGFIRFGSPLPALRAVAATVAARVGRRSSADPD